MMEFLVKFQSTVYAQIGLFLVLAALYLISQRKLPTFRIMGFAVIRLVIVSALFLYLFLNWSSEVNPSLRNASVMGIFIVNLYTLWQVILTRMELPYRLALDACGRQPKNSENFRHMVQAGKRFYYLRYFWQALVSGSSIQRFLHGVAREQVRYDLQKSLHQHGSGKRVINFQMQMAFLKRQLSEDDTFPQEFREVIVKAIDDFANHRWIEEQVDAFLLLATESPEDLISSSWAEEWQKIMKT
jgi:hypothetical protein